MQTRIFLVRHAVGLAGLLMLTANCAAELDGKVSDEAGENTKQVERTYDPKTRKQAAELYNAIVDNDIENDIEKIKAALQKGLSPEERYLRNMSAMELAANTGRPEAMNLLIRSGGDPNHKNKKNIPLLALVLDNHYRWDKKRIEKLKQEKNSAIPPDSKGVAYVLLRHGADPNAIFPFGEGRGQPVLSYAAEYNDLEMVKILVGLGADVNAPKISNLAPLFFAAKNGNVEMSAFFVKWWGRYVCL